MLKKNGKLRICVDFRKLNRPTKKNPYPLPFSNEVLNIVARYEAYSFLNRCSGYHQIPLRIYTKKICNKLGSFCLDGDVIWCKKWANFRETNFSKTFKNYLNQFMKIFLDDFTIYSDIESHFMKLRFFL